MFICDYCRIKVYSEYCPECSRDIEGLKWDDRHKARSRREVFNPIMGKSYVEYPKKRTPFPGAVKPGSVRTSRRLFSWQKEGK